MKFSITRGGKPLDPSLYTWDEETKTLSTDESNLVLDFSDMGACTFKTGDDCTFRTGDNCTFRTGSECTFKTGSECAFITREDCTFMTWMNCTFDTGSGCTFNTEWYCTFDTGSGCTFNTGQNCIFKTKENCIFNIYNSYKEIKHDKGCVAIIRKDAKIKRIIDFDEPSSVRFLKEGDWVRT